MIIETFIATIKHDNGKFRLRVVSLNGEKGAIEQITLAEHCPECAIMKLVKIKSEQIL